MCSYSNDLAPAVETEFGELLRACDTVDGIERIRFTSPHPKDFRYLGDCRDGGVRSRLRARPPAGAVRVGARPEGDAADIHPRALPGAGRPVARRDPGSRARAPTSSSASPGRPEEDFRATLDLVEEVRYESAFTFIYSPRHGTEAGEHGRSGARRREARAAGNVSSRSVQRIAGERNQERIGRLEEVLRRGYEPHWIRRSCAGAAAWNTMVNFSGSGRAGELVDVLIDRATSTTLRGVAPCRRRSA